MVDRKLNDKDVARIIRELREVQAAADLSDVRIAGITGVSASVISQIKRGVYKGDSDRVLVDVDRWLSTRTEVLDAPDADYVPTTIGERIQTVCDMAVFRRTMGIVSTPSGWGKTVALREAARVRKSRCCLVYAGEAMNTKRELTSAIGDAMGMSGLVADPPTILRKVRKKLHGYYGGGRAESYLIIVDEATTLRPAAINMLRGLHDDPACRAAVVLADTVSRLDSFLHGRNQRVIAGGNEQLRSRATAQYHVTASDTMLREDVRLVAAATLKAAGHRRKLDRHALDYLARLASEPGALRNVVARIENVGYLASRRNLAADYSVAQLDYVATLSGDAWRMQHDTVPFGPTASGRKRKVG